MKINKKIAAFLLSISLFTSLNYSNGKIEIPKNKACKVIFIDDILKPILPSFLCANIMALIPEILGLSNGLPFNANFFLFMYPDIVMGTIDIFNKLNPNGKKIMVIDADNKWLGYLLAKTLTGLTSAIFGLAYIARTVSDK